MSKPYRKSLTRRASIEWLTRVLCFFGVVAICSWSLNFLPAATTLSPAIADRTYPLTSKRSNSTTTALIAVSGNSRASTPARYAGILQQEPDADWAASRPGFGANLLSTQSLSASIVSNQLAEIEAFMVLSDDEHQALSSRLMKVEALTNSMGVSETDDQTLIEQRRQLESLDDILGTERANELSKHFQAKEVEMQTEAIEQRVSQLSRKLGLSNQQEERVSEILRAANRHSEDFILQQNSESDPEVGMSEITVDDLIKASQRAQDEEEKYLQHALKRVLSEEQYNYYLQFEAQIRPRSTRLQLTPTVDLIF